MALHDLFALAAETGRIRVAERLAARAAEAYGPGHPRLPNLAQDLAFLWIENGRFAPSLELQQRIRSDINGFPERLILESAIARAAAGAGRLDVYERAAAEALTRVPDPEVHEGVAAALLNLAYAATSAGEWDRAVRTAERARRISEQTREGKIRLEAEAVHEKALRQLQIAPGAERIDTPQPDSVEHTREVSKAFHRLLAGETA
jgi:tetratricopeptide (TPR) repeat protein